MSAYVVSMELAPAANLSATPSSWSWTDYTDKVFMRDAIVRTWGRRDRFPGAAPARLTMTLDNTGGFFVPDNPTSALYGLIDENTPIRVLVAPRENTASDAFNRTSASSWGSADVGGAWTLTGAAGDYGVSASTGGRHTNTAAGSGHFSTLAFSVHRVDMRVRVRAVALSTGAAQTAGIVCRYIDSINNIRAEINFGTTGALTARIVSRVAGVDSVLASATVPGLTHSTSAWYWIHLQTGYTSARMQVWLDGTTEPRDWLIDGADGFNIGAPGSGAVGCWSRRETGNTNANAALDFDDFSFLDGPYILQTCHVDEWPTEWSDPTGNQSLAKISASGRLRLLQEAKPLGSSTYRAFKGSSALVAYWPMEEGSGATTFASSVSGGQPAVPSGLNPAADSAVVGSAPLPTVSATGRVQFVVPPYAATMRWSVRHMFRVPQSPSATAQVLSWSTPGGTIARWQLTIAAGAPDTIRLEGYDAAGTATFIDSSVNLVDPTSSAELTNGRQLFFGYDGVQNGANIDLSWTIWFAADDGTGVTSIGRAPSVAATLANVTLLSHDANSGWTASGGGHTLGHVAVGTDAVGPAGNAVDGYAGELTSARLSRLCALENVSSWFGEILTGSSGTTTQTMGPTPIKTLYGHLQQIESTESGILFDGRQGQVTIMPRSLRENRTVNLALDLSQAHMGWPWRRTRDTQAMTTEVTVTRPDGSTVVSKASDALIQRVGLKPQQVEVNSQRDVDLRDHADWWLALGTSRKGRYPQIPLVLHRSTDLIRDYLEMDVGGRIQVTNLPAELPPDDLELLAEGGADVIDPFEWRASINASDGSQWLVGLLDTGRPDCGASTTAEVLDTTETGVDLAIADNCVWAHDDGDYHIEIGGEVMTVTAVSAAAGAGFAWTQTLTVTRSVNGVVKSHALGAEVHIADADAFVLAL